MIEWSDEPFELLMFLRNLPKIASSTELIECSRCLKLSVKFLQIKKNKSKFYFGIGFQFQFWLYLIVLQFIYYILSITIFPKLEQY